MSPEKEPQWMLRPMGGDGLPPAIDIGVTAVSIGRDPSNDVVIDQEHWPHVSSHHSRVRLDEGVPIIEDLGSRNGTLVNGDLVETRVLRNGDVVQLGDLGPRLAVVRSLGMDETLPIMGPPPGRPKRAFGNTTVTDLRKLIGAARPEDVSEAVRKGSRRMLRIAVAIVLASLALAAAGVYFAYVEGRREAEDLRSLTAKLTLEVESARSELTHQRASFEAERGSLEEQRQRLEARIHELNEAGRSASDSVQELRGELAETNARLKLFDPVNLERERLEDVARVHRAVVLIESRMHLVDVESGRRLFIDRDAAGQPRPNLEGRGEPFTQESTGSGFCVSEDGWVITNAHVVRPEGSKTLIQGPGGLSFRPVIEVECVFTGTSERRKARVERVEYGDETDMALVRINPFEGMPVIAGFTTELEPPTPGSEVFLFGFPLGKLVLQEGDTVVASTFKGILSRRVGAFLQVDASVHPGNSGGPVTDVHGRVVGIVTRVQSTPNGELATAIGYVLPVRAFDRIWPPPSGE